VTSGRAVVVVVGAASRDRVEDDPRGWRLGGGASYSALALARLGLRTRVLLGLDEAARTATELRLLEDAGVEVVGVPLDHGPVFDNVETPDGRAQRAYEVSDPIPVTAVPRGWLNADGWVFAPVAAELPEQWAMVPATDALVAVGWQGLLRVLVPGAPVRQLEPAPSPIVRRGDVVGVGTDDFDRTTPLERLAAFVGPGDTLLVTDGVRGGTAIETARDGASTARTRWAAIPVPRAVDPTGAGDTFLAGVFAARFAPAILGDHAGEDADLRFGAAVASLTCEGPGLHGVPELSAVLERLASPDQG
jgi:sugar/nucleoside kinase (ribokinase family)